ncbi:unnamed protein product [Adineta steineri]|uniref:Uncharacterized protein n=1 Tax=Adineta steineri TaxID=433720 RepID=A0A818TZ42_9BILA|nr:unnamed protein product [Adineta steineri]
MIGSRQSLARLSDDGQQQVNYSDNNEIIYYDDQQEEVETFNEFEDFVPSAKSDANKFRMLCDHVQNSLSDIDNSMFELLELKDNLLLQFLPANVSTRITLVISRLYRAYSLSQIPLNELVRIVNLYSQPFDMKSVVIKRFYESNETKKRMLNAALQRLTSMEANNKRHQQIKMINNWEKMYIRLALPRSNVRKWKFRLKTFRDTAQLGYEHVIEWLNTSAARPTTGTEVLSKGESAADDEVDIDDMDRADSSGGEDSVQEVDDQHHGSDYGDEIGSDNEGSFLSSAGKQRTKRVGESDKKDQVEEQAVMAKIDIEIQATPSVDDQYTSTGDVLSSKALIIRVYRPIGLSKTKFQCIIHTLGQNYKTNVFSLEKPVTPKSDNAKPSKRGTTRPTKKPIDSKNKNLDESTAIPEETDINTIDKEQCDELIIPVPTFLKRRSLLETDTDPEAIHIDILGDDKPCGSVILSPEDLRLLELPDLHSPSFAPLITIDDNTTNVVESTSKTNQLEFEEQSYDLYKAWISRTPQTFTVYNDKREPIGKLPLHLFWYNKVEVTHATKCTMTAPMQSRVPTGKTVSIPQTPKTSSVPPTPPSRGTQERDIPTIVVQTTSDIEEIVEPVGNISEDNEEQIEMVKATYEDKIVKICESYEAEIDRLKKLLSETSSYNPNQMPELSELEENIRDIIGEESPTANTSQRQSRAQSKREVNTQHHPAPPDIPGPARNFLDRYQMYLDRSVKHRNRLMTKVEQETAQTIERQMAIQHRLHKPDQNGERYDDLCLPAVFMPFKSGNVFNPRAYRFFHHTGSSDPRLTQTPSIFKLPPLPSGSVSVLNLFELSRCYDAATENGQLAPEPNRPVTSPTNQQAN